MKKLSIVIPVYNEEENIRPLIKSIDELSINFVIEYIFVNDGSNDNTLNTLKELAKINQSIKYLSFSRNFGHQIALTAGLDHANGEIIIMMDADFQHPPEYIPELIKKHSENFQVVQMVKKNQGKRNFLIKLYSYLFYSFLRLFSDIKISNNVSDFRLIDKKVNNELKKLKEKEKFLRGLVQWVGFKYCEIEYIPNQRKYGKSKYNLFKLIKLASYGIFAFSTIPLRVSLYSGILLSALSFFYGLFAIVKKFFSPESSPVGYTDLIFFITFIGGIQLIFLGLIGLYISKIYDQVRDRPLYVIDEKNINA